jgi:hypothetical protein
MKRTISSDFMGPNNYYSQSDLQNQRGGPSADLLPHTEKEQGRTVEQE